MKRYAVIIGVEEYNHFAPTRFCHDDAQLMADVLTHDCDYTTQDVLVELPSPSDCLGVESYLSAIEKLVQGAQAGDTILFYFAGHGHFVDGESYLILPSTDPGDFAKTALPLRDVCTRLRKPQCVNVRIFDACHSGSDVRDGESSPTNSEEFVRDIVSQATHGWFTFAACQESEFSYGDPALRHGAFTYHFCEAIRSIPEEEPVLPETLKVKVCTAMESWAASSGHVQTPVFNAAIAGNLHFARRTRSKAPPEGTLPNNPLLLRDAFKSRLERVSTLIPRSAEDRNQALQRILETVRAAMKAHIDEFMVIDQRPSMLAATQTIDIPEELKKRIVQHLDDRDLRSLHECKVYKQYESQDEYSAPALALGFSMFGRGRKVISTDYILRQPHEMPPSFQLVEVPKGALVPGYRVFIYILPLQLSAVLVGGVEEVLDAIQIPQSIKRPKLTELRIGLSDPGTAQSIDGFIIELIGNASSFFARVLEERLSYLEREGSVAGISAKP